MGVLDANGKQSVFPEWDLPPVYRGNRYPGKEENAFECSIAIPAESVALAQLAEQAEKCDDPEDLEIPSILRKYF